MKFYTYIHRRMSDNSVFYVGKGTGNRAAHMSNRNEFWKRTVAKHGVQIEICARWATEADAYAHEEFLVACFKGMGAELCNLSDGGIGGATGSKWSEERRSKMKDASKKKIVCVETGVTFDSLNDAATWSGANASNIGSVAAGRKKAAGGYRWMYAEEYSVEAAATRALPGYSMGGAHYLARRVECIETGQVFDTTTSAAKWAGASITDVCAVVNGRRKIAAGYTWRAYEPT